MRRLARLSTGSLVLLFVVAVGVHSAEAMNPSLELSSINLATLDFDGAGHFVFRNSDGTDTGAADASRDFQIASAGALASLVGLH